MTRSANEGGGAKLVRWAAGIALGILIMAASVVAFKVLGIFLPVSTHFSPAVVPSPQPDRTDVALQLTRGEYHVWHYAPGQKEFAAHPRSVLIFGSGDGGFDGWEDRVCKALQADGNEVVGFDCAAYAKTDYDLPTLQRDMASIAHHFRSRDGDLPPPVIYGGWSMGAVQALAAAGGPDRPLDVAGLLMISPGDRGRYGLRGPDRWDVPPTGPGTFAVMDFARSLGGMRVAQWDGRLDLLDSTKWLHSITTTHRAFVFPFGLHDYDGASDDFLIRLKASVRWILGRDAPS